MSSLWVKITPQNVVLVCHLHIYVHPTHLTQKMSFRLCNACYVPICNECMFSHKVYACHTVFISWWWLLNLPGFCCFWGNLLWLCPELLGRRSLLASFAALEERVLCSDLSISRHAISWLILSQQSWIWLMLSTTSMVSMVNATCQIKLIYWDRTLVTIFFNFPWHPSSSTKHSFLSS